MTIFIIIIIVMWMLWIGIMGEKLYQQKGSRKGSRGTKDQLRVDMAILKKSRRLTNWSMAWIDYKKAYDMVPHS